MEVGFLQNLGIAVMLAMLVGIERERSFIGKREVFKFAGIRTFGLIGLLGALTAVFSKEVGYVFPLVAAFLFLLVVGSYVVSSLQTKHYGSTTEIASVVVFLNGALAGMGEYMLATVSALTVLMLLHFKGFWHSVAKKINQEELVSAMKFIIVAFVILPLLPNESFGPYGFFNPYVVWLMVVLISGISFVSYIAMKIFGRRLGILLTGFLGGLISSTALTLSFAYESKKNPADWNSYATGVLVAGSAMFFRVLLEVFVLSRELAFVLVYELVAMGIAGFGFAAFIYFKNRTRDEKISRAVSDLKSPFRLKPALSFAVFFSAILLLVEFAKATLGNSGIYLTSVVSGIMDVDAISISLTQMFESGELSLMTAVYGVLIAVAVNTLVKSLMFLFFGNRKGAIYILVSYLLVILIGGVIVYFF